MILNLLLLISCAHMSAPIDPGAIEDAEDTLTMALREAVRVQACMVYFQEILDIQNKRENNNKIMAEATEKHNAREISLVAHKDAFASFITEENNLYSEVTNLYNASYALECFE